MCQGPRREDEGAAVLAQAQVEDQVLAMVEPFGVAADGLPGAFAKGDAAAAGQEVARVDLAAQRQGRRAQGQLKDALRVGAEEAGHSLGLRVGQQRLRQLLQPVRREAHAGVSHGDEVTTGSADGEVAAAADVAAGLAEQAQRQAFAVALQERDAVILAAAIDDNDLVGRARLRQQRLQQRGQAGALVADGEDERDHGGSILTAQQGVGGEVFHVS